MSEDEVPVAAEPQSESEPIEVNGTDEVEADAEADQTPEVDDDRIPLKVNGEEVRLTMEEVIAEAQKGVDYTRKTQELAEERKQIQNLVTFFDKMEDNPEWGLNFLRELYSDKLPQQQPEGEGLDPVQKELAEVKARLEAQETQARAEQVATQAQSLADQYGLDSEAIIKHAIDLGGVDLAVAAKALAFDSSQTTALTEKAKRLRAKSDASFVEGGGGSSKAVGTNPAAVSSVEEAFELAMRKHGALS